MPEVTPLIHRVTSSPQGALVNAYLIETEDGVVAIDSLLTVSDSRTLRRRLETLGKPLQAVLLTQSHPDHYGGLTELVAGDDVPIIAPQGVHDTIRRDDEVKDQILRPMFGEQWTHHRTFPNTTISDGESVTFGGVTITVIDLGPSESPHDSPWVLADDDRTAVFLGDQIYDHMHCYLADGFFTEWLANIDRLAKRFDGHDPVFHIGHGGPVGREGWDRQRRYIRTFVAAIDEADWKDPVQAKTDVIETMTSLLPVPELQFLMELSIEPIATKLGVLQVQAPQSIPAGG
jgi:glyoxylase-like metal-dependent hydrolase (beta-lactamase superfamily II)